jgi:hypothetical protein
VALSTASTGLTFLVGADDTDDGISLVVVGEDFPRVTITSAGVAVGDGSQAPSIIVSA